MLIPTMSDSKLNEDSGLPSYEEASVPDVGLAPTSPTLATAASNSDIRSKPLPPSPSSHSSPPPEATRRLSVPLVDETNRFSSASTSPQPSPTFSVHILGQALDSGKGKMFNSKKKTAKEVRAAVLKVINDTVRAYPKRYNDPEAEPLESIFANCATSCSTAGISFPSVLQEPSMESHSPVYWAILQRSDEIQREHPSSLVTLLLRHSTDLQPAVRVEIRTACLLTNNQELFQNIRALDAYSPAASLGLVRGEQGQADIIDVDEPSLSEFTVRIEILKFMRRMKHFNVVELEFIARARLWRLAFEGVPKDKDGRWKVSLSLLESSPPTFVDADLFIYDAAGLHRAPAPLPDINIGLRSTHELVRSDAKPTRAQRREISVSLDEAPEIKSVHELTTYLSTEETLKAKLVVNMAKPAKDSSCTIC